MRALVLLLTACTGTKTTPTTETTGDTSVDCETIPDRTCGNAATGDTGCPDGYSCWGPSAFVCYRGMDCNLPICLPPITAIGTPEGPRPIRALRVGDRVYTLDDAGERIVAPIARLGSTLAPVGHRVVHVVLADGRALRGSPGHPTADGRTLDELVPGDILDGAEVFDVQREPYPFARTFDLLPAGPTGAYEADGIWLGSTLH